MKLKCPTEPTPESWHEWESLYDSIFEAFNPSTVTECLLEPKMVMSQQHITMSLRPYPSTRMVWVFWTTQKKVNIIIMIPFASVLKRSKEGAYFIYDVWDEVLWRGNGSILDVESTEEGQWVVDCYKFGGVSMIHTSMYKKRRAVQITSLHRDTYFKSGMHWIPTVSPAKIESLSVKRYSFDGILALPKMTGHRWKYNVSEAENQERTSEIPT